MKKCIMVLGMHRSGTSALAGVLNLLGVSLGTKLMNPNQYNVKGYFENDSVFQFNEKLLQTLDSSWDDLFFLEKDWWKKQNLGVYRNKIFEIVEQEFNGTETFYIKDPRLCILLPFWNNLFEKIGIKTSCIICLRNPLEVASSLEKRDGFSIQKGILLWMTHMLSTEFYSRCLPRVFISYYDLLNKPENTIARISDVLNTDFPESYQKSKKDIEQFLEPNLKHFNIDDTKLEQDVIGLTCQYYNILLKLTRKNSTNHEELLEIDKIRKEFDKIQNLFYNQEIKALAGLEGVVGQKNSLLQDQAQQIQSKVAAIQEQEQQIRSKDATIQEQEQQIRSKDATIQEQEQQIRSKDAAIQEQEQQIQSKDAAIQEQEQQIQSKDAAIQEHARQIDLLQLHVENERLICKAILNSRSWRIMAPLRWMSIYVRKSKRKLRTIRYLFNRQYRLIKKSGLFDTSYYLEQNSDVAESGMNPLVHYLELGAGEGRDPIALFDTSYYLEQNPDVAESGMNPLVHYLELGAGEGRDPVALFDTSYYLEQNPDVAESGMNPLVHYLAFGAGEGRDPNPLSDTSYYDDEFVAENNETYSSDNSRIRTIAFYLPQFHPIPENDKWWGKGFTEWTNVSKATPQFIGHYQPRLPGELGFYDLRLVDVQKQQVELAKKYGIYGFCFHYYWFSGRRLLERPINQFLSNKELDFPFCFCWANENWTRRWDGQEDEILIAQSHKKEDVIAFIKDLEFALKDRRYIKVDGKPLLIVYLASNLPNPVETVKCWRNYCIEVGIGDLYLVAAQTFGLIDPKPYGFDAAVEFPPHNEIDEAINDKKILLNSGFKGKVYDYKNLVQRKSYTAQPEFEHYPTVFPSWDNEARMPGKGRVFWGSSPDLYQKWFKSACDYADTNNKLDKKIVFINAWNEWAEGAHLEPDRKYGYAYLQATADVLRQYPSLNALKRVSNKSGNRRILLVAHDAHPMGAQYIILHIAKALVEDFGFAVDMVVLGDGPLLEDYKRYATLHMLSGKDARGEKAKALAVQLFTEGVRSAIANTAVTGLFAQVLKEQGFHVISLIHELPGIIKYYNLQPHLKSIAEYADSIVFPAKKVLEGFERFSQISSQQAVICPQGLYRKNLIRNTDQIEEARKGLRSQLGLPKNAQIVLCVGHGDHRKGIDLFVDIGMLVIEQMPDTYFLWVGRVEPDIMKAVESSGFPQHYIFTGYKSQVDIYYAGSDVFALTSREDPFPSVIMEALDVKIPVVAFDEAGGFTDLLSRGGGQLVPAFETDAFARAVTDLLSQPENAHALGVSGYEIVEREFSFRRYVFDLLKLTKTPIKRVSVIIPNYNYAEYLTERIKTIVDQKYPIYEIIILDDASTDDSVSVINKIISTLNIDCRLIVNESNSGNPFAQWLKGVELSQGDYVWIAEADDLSEPGFLDEVLQPFEDPSVVMSYCQSKQMDSECKILCDDYLDYVSDVSSTKWLKPYIEEGLDEISNCLAIKNTIPNVSAVMFNRNTLLHVLKERREEIIKYRVAGDWVTYIYTLEQGRIAYSPKAYNLHRRHQHSVTIGNLNLSQLKEIIDVQQKVRNGFRPNEKVLIKAKAYSQRLYEEFNLVSSDAPVLTEHPQLSACLKN